LADIAAPKGAATPVEPTRSARKAAPSVKAQKEGEEVERRSITVKLDPPRHRQLMLEKVETGRSHQEILLAAFDHFMQLPPGKRY
jgi:hypothetical protein